MFSLIAAVGKNLELGKNGKLIFHIKEDMKYFKNTTQGHKVVMGRKTWDSLPGKLSGRENIVISRHEVAGADKVVHDLSKYIDENKDTDEEIFVIGGGQVYVEFLPYAKYLYLTEVDAVESKADAYFPEFDKSKYNREMVKEGKDDGLIYTFVRYCKK